MAKRQPAIRERLGSWFCAPLQASTQCVRSHSSLARSRRKTSSRSAAAARCFINRLFRFGKKAVRATKIWLVSSPACHLIPACFFSAVQHALYKIMCHSHYDLQWKIVFHSPGYPGLPRIRAYTKLPNSHQSFLYLA